ncbi:MAG: ATP-binding protein [Coprobacillus sp.]
MDFCVLLGNLLENAVYGCKNVEQDRKITLKIGQTTSNIIVLEIKNPYVGSIKKVNDKFMSSRHSGEGQGLKSVRLIAEKYNGFIKVNYDDQFDVKVLLNI